MSYDQTLQDISNAVAKKLSMEAGSNVQPYAEARIKSYIQDIFDIIFYKRYWQQYSQWHTATLDGVTGVVTTNLTSILKRWTDLSIVVPDQEVKPLPIVTRFGNPYTITGTFPKYLEAMPTTSTKIFRVYPLASIGDVQFYCRTKPDNFSDNGVIEFDSMALIYGAAFLYAEDDATNLGAVDKFKGMFELRLKQLEEAEDQHPFSLKRVDSSYPTEWEG